MQFGKWKGIPVDQVPDDYLEWLMGNSKDNIAFCEAELKRRKDVEEADQTWVERIVSEGYRSLAKKTHPDAGGSEEAFRQIQAAYEQLKVVLKEVKDV